MKNLKLFVFSLIFSVLSLNVIFAGHGFSQTVNDFTITKFSADYVITNQDPQGFLEVTEDIQLNFSGQNRGIIRSIPDKYKDEDLNIELLSVSRDGQPEPFITYKENNNFVIRIGDPDTYITSNHTYQIKYTAENVINFYDTHDEFYWDVNGDQWQQSFLLVDAVVGSEARLSSTKNPVCFTGQFGENNSDCEISYVSSSPAFTTTKPLASSETLTIAIAYEKGYFTAPSWLDRNWGLIVVSPIILAQILVAFTAYKRWRIYGKDYDGKPIAPYFERPKGLSVMQASYVLNNHINPQYITASLIDLCIRGNLRIIEKVKGKKVKHEIQLVRKTGDYNSEDEALLVDTLFANKNEGSKIVLEDNKNKYHKLVNDLAVMIDEKSIISGYYELSPRNSFKKLLPHLFSAILLFVLGILFSDFTNGVSFITSILMMIIVVVLMFLMTKRSVVGNMIADHMRGLKLYLEKAEKDRIKMQDAVAAPLAKNSSQPVRNRQFFEKLLPYAIALGVEKSWAEAFKEIYVEPPDWYSGNWSTFSTVALLSSISSTSSASNLSFSSPSSSSSSGMGGGGFSGGGGGGGGGAGW